MRLISLENLKGTEILGKKIYDDDGRTLLNPGVKLTPFYIERLKEIGINSIYIDDEISKDIVIEENISEKTRQMSKQAIKDMVDKYSRYGKVNNEGIVKSVNSIIDEILAKKDVMLNVSEIRSKDKNIYTHSVNVCVLASFVGIHMGYNMIKLKDMAIGAILHDIGKVKIMRDKKIKEGMKTNEELNRYIEDMHPKLGYDFLSSENLCNAFSKVAVLMHHERVDGSGYPLKLKGNEINEIARLVSICNVFDNMISGKNDSKPKPIYEVIEYLVGMGGSYFDIDMVKKFSTNISAYPIGSSVKLSTQEKGLVLRQNTSMPTRPVVKVLFDSKGQKVSQPYEIDLIKDLTIFIIQTCEI